MTEDIKAIADDVIKKVRERWRKLDGYSQVLDKKLPCPYCNEGFQDDENIQIVATERGPRIFHHECVFRMGVGSVGHQMGMCHCFGFVDHSEDGLTKREAARRSLAHYNSRHKNEIP